MQPDLTRPGAADAFESCVSLYVDGVSREDEETMVRAGMALTTLLDITGGSRDTLLRMVIEAAAEAVRVAAGVRRPS